MVLCFDDFNLDLETRQLRRANEVIHLSPKAFELLRFLLENRPKALAKRDLQERLWPATYVSETNLPTLIAEIRTALADSARTPRFIRTVHRFGYAFCGVAVESGTAQMANATEPARCWLVLGSRKFALIEGVNLIGRDPAATVWLDSTSISRRHSNIRVQSGRVVLDDLGSKNGTFVRNKRIATAELHDGDQIRFGSVRFTLRVVSSHRSTETRLVGHVVKARS